MKTKSFAKKLVLNKETVANLSKEEMDELHGGTNMPLNCATTTCICTLPYDWDSCRMLTIDTLACCMQR